MFYSSNSDPDPACNSPPSSGANHGSLDGRLLRLRSLGRAWTGRVASVWGVTPVMTFSALVCITTALLLLLTGVLAEKPIPPIHRPLDQ